MEERLQVVFSYMYENIQSSQTPEIGEWLPFDQGYWQSRDSLDSWSWGIQQIQYTPIQFSNWNLKMVASISGMSPSGSPWGDVTLRKGSFVAEKGL